MTSFHSHIVMKEPLVELVTISRLNKIYSIVYGRFICDPIHYLLYECVESSLQKNIHHFYSFSSGNILIHSIQIYADKHEIDIEPEEMRCTPIIVALRIRKSTGPCECIRTTNIYKKKS